MAWQADRHAAEYRTIVGDLVSRTEYCRMPNSCSVLPANQSQRINDVSHEYCISCSSVSCACLASASNSRRVNFGKPALSCNGIARIRACQDSGTATCTVTAALQSHAPLGDVSFTPNLDRPALVQIQAILGACTSRDAHHPVFLAYQRVGTLVDTSRVLCGLCTAVHP